MKWFWYGMLGFGACLLLFALSVGVPMYLFELRAVPTTAHIEAPDVGEFDPVAVYVDRRGDRHRLWLDASYDAAIGETIELVYDPEHPQVAAPAGPKQGYRLPLGLAVLGGLPFVVGLVGLVLRARRRREVRALMRDGTRVEAEVVDVETTSFRVNARPLWVIRARWRGPDGVAHEFRSRLLRRDPRERWSGSSLGVWFDPARPERHVVDTDAAGLS